MRVIDVDAHFVEPIDWWLDVVPELVGDLPRPDPSMQGFLDLRGQLPPWLRPDDPDDVRSLSGLDHAQRIRAITPAHFDPASADPCYSGAGRVAQLDEWGIDVQWLNPTGGHYIIRIAASLGRTDLLAPLLAAWNTWCANQVEEHRDRLMPVTHLDFVNADIEWNLAEMTRMRERGSRSIRPRQHPDKSLAHPDFEPIWSAAEDLGMVLYLHAGFGNGVEDSLHHSYANSGRGFNTWAEMEFLMSTTAPRNVIAALVYDGVFARHPRLGVVVCELRTEWLPQFLHEIDARTSRVALDGAPRDSFYDLPLKPSEYVARQVRVSPLTGFVATGFEHLSVAEVLERVPHDMLVFSSDFPHPEGRPDAVRLMSEYLPNDPDLRRRFYGESIADLIGV